MTTARCRTVDGTPIRHHRAFGGYEDREGSPPPKHLTIRQTINRQFSVAIQAVVVGA